MATVSEFAEYSKSDAVKDRKAVSFISVEEARKLGRAEIDRVRKAGLESWDNLKKSNLFPSFQTPPPGYLRACYCGCYITVENGDQYQTAGGIRGYSAMYLTPFDKLPVKMLDSDLKPFFREVVRYGQEPYQDPDDPDRVFEQAGVISTASCEQGSSMEAVAKVLRNAGIKHRLVLASQSNLEDSILKSLKKLPKSKVDDLWRYGVTLDGSAIRLENDLRSPNKQLWQLVSYFKDMHKALNWLKVEAKIQNKQFDSDLTYVKIVIEQADNCQVIGELHADLAQLTTRVRAIADAILKYLEDT